MRRFGVLLSAVLLLAGGCGGDDGGSDDGIPSLASDTTVTATTPRLEADEALLDFSQCMRDEGIELPDIAVDEDGAPILDPALLDVIDVQSDEFTAAFDTCQPILERSGAFDVEIDPELQAQIEDDLFAFSACMRTEGFEDFPDPVFRGGASLPYPISVLAQLDDPKFEAAVEVCQEGLAFGDND